ncbi:MAG: hypothetical protein LUE21_06850 [Oscillospiraceae bacterium]|nr:hypothetical protein [Oscillospiraceae bacterium]
MKKMFSVLLALAMAFSLTACNAGGGVKQTAEETEETTEELFKADSEYISEEDLLPFIALYDLYVAQRSEASADTAEDEDEPYDPLYCLSTLNIYDEDVVLSVAFDSAAVDVTVPGDYELTFIVTIDRGAYDAAVSGTSSTEPVTEEVIITKTVHIVTTEDYAAALADGTIAEISEGTAIVVVEDEVDEVAVEEDSDEEDGEDAEEDAEDNDTSDDDSTDNDTTDSSTDNSDSDNTSTNNDSDTSDVTATSSPTTTTAPATSTGSGTSTSSGSTSSGSTSSGSTSSGSSSGSTSTGSSSSSSSSGTTNTGSTSSGSTSSGSTSSGSTSSGSTSSGSTSSGSTSSGSTSSGSTSSGSSSSGSTSSGSTSSSTATATPAPTATTHVHTWVVETVEDGYTEKVQVSTSYDYSQATWVDGYYMCKTCGEKFSSGEDCADHVAFVCGGSYTYVSGHYEGTIIENPVYEDVWVDTSYTITYCSECGATQ